MSKIVAMGEILLRLSPPSNEKFIQANCFNTFYGGSEANVAVSLANFGYDVEFITKVPDNPIGKSAIASLNKMNVKTNNVIIGGKRMGIYFVEEGSAIRASTVTYDRANSSISEAAEEEFDFEEILDGADIFCISGITPALSDNAVKLTEKALEIANKKNITVVCDLNYRSKLWNYKNARKVMTNLMKYVDICVAGGIDAVNVLELKQDIEHDINSVEGCKYIFEQLVEKYKFKYVFNSVRNSISASDNEFIGCGYDGREFVTSRTYRVSPIIDRIGGGDAFTAGAICGLLDGKELQKVVEFATAAETLKHTIPGEVSLFTKEEVKNIVDGDTFGRIKR